MYDGGFLVLRTRQLRIKHVSPRKNLSRRGAPPGIGCHFWPHWERSSNFELKMYGLCNTLANDCGTLPYLAERALDAILAFRQPGLEQGCGYNGNRPCHWSFLPAKKWYGNPSESSHSPDESAKATTTAYNDGLRKVITDRSMFIQRGELMVNMVTHHGLLHIQCTATCFHWQSKWSTSATLLPTSWIFSTDSPPS